MLDFAQRTFGYRPHAAPLPAPAELPLPAPGTITALLGVSKDPPAKHVKFAAKHAMAAPLASDAAAGGLSDALGIWTEKSMYGRTYMGMERTTYLVDADGRIARVWNKVKVKGHAAEVLDAARAL